MTSKKGRKRKSNKKKKISILDILLCLILCACAAYAASIIIPLGLLPNTWIILLGLLLVIGVLVTLILSLLNIPFILHILYRLVICIISAALIAGTYTVNRVDEAVAEVIKTPESYVEYISIVTLRESGIISLDDLKGKVVGVQASVDTESMELALNHMSSHYESDPKTKKYQDYTKAIQGLYKNEVSAIVLSETYRPLVEENISDFKEKTAIIDAIQIEKPVVDIVKQIDITSNAFTVLVSGIDTLGVATINSPSDVNMLITVNPLTKSITMTSIPRDSYLENACLGYKRDKLTHTGLYGMDCTIQTIENAFDVDINYYAKISFSSLINVVNALGGIEVDVPMSFCERKANRVDIIYINKGKQILNGEQALALARNRQNVSGGDLGRAKNQQMIINAIIRKCLNPDILGKIDELITVVGQTVQMNLTKQEIYSFVNMVANDLTTPWTISNNVVVGENGWGECASIPGMDLSVVEISEEEINKTKFIVKKAITDADLSELAFNINSIEITTQEESVEGEGETEGAKGYDFCWITLKQQQEKEQAEMEQEPEINLDDLPITGEESDEVAPSVPDENNENQEVSESVETNEIPEPSPEVNDDNNKNPPVTWEE